MSNILYSALTVVLFLVGIKIASALFIIEVPEFVLGWMSSAIFIYTMDICLQNQSGRVGNDQDVSK